MTVSIHEPTLSYGRPKIRADHPPIDVRVAGRRAAKTLRPGERWIVGSAAGADLVVAGLASHHCVLSHRGGSVEVEDLGDRGGVRIGGALVRWAELPTRACVDLGAATLELSPAQPDRELLSGMVGHSPAMRALASLARRVAALPLPVLVRGETGTGKELCARALHDESPRACGPFVALSGAVINGSLGLSLLFGHVAGAYTGAQGERAGAFRQADRGTLFIDEVGALSLEAQATLLRALEEQRVVPVGADRPVPVDVRIVAATCEPLERRIADGSFRLDLYQRLAACVLVVPPLRERRGDIPALAEHLISISDIGCTRIETAALERLRRDPLPGNVRELKNLLIDAALRAQGGVITVAEIAAAIGARRATPTDLDPGAARALLDSVGGNVSEAARRAGMARSTFRDRLLKE